MELSFIQRVTKFVCNSGKFEEIMKESKQWKFKCSCGQISNIWEIGGIRYKAAGNPSKGLVCPFCKKFSMQKLFKSEF